MTNRGQAEEALANLLLRGKNELRKQNFQHLQRIKHRVNIILAALIDDTAHEAEKERAKLLLRIGGHKWVLSDRRELFHGAFAHFGFPFNSDNYQRILDTLLEAPHTTEGLKEMTAPE